MKKQLTAIALILLLPHMTSALKVFTPFYDTYSAPAKDERVETSGGVSRMTYRRGPHSRRLRTQWHDRKPSQWHTVRQQNNRPRPSSSGR